MGPASASSSLKASEGKPKFGVGYVVLVLPFLALLALLWFASHRVSRPTISIFQAIATGDYGAVDAHLKTGTAVNVVNQEGHTPLFYAISEEKPRIVQLLLENGASVNAENRGMISPLYQAAGQGDLGLVRQLLERGARADEVFKHGSNVLHAAADAGNPDVVRLLIDKGANVNAQAEATGGTPLCNAVVAGNLEVARILLDHGADPHLTGPLKRTPLHFAAGRGDVKMVRLLLAHGASPDAKDSYNVIPLMGSLERAHDDVSWVLLPVTKNVKVVDTQNYYNLLHFAVTSKCSVPIIKELIKRGVNVNGVDDQGDTPLAIAISENYKEAADALAAAGARVPLSALIQAALNPPVSKKGAAFVRPE